MSLLSIVINDAIHKKMLKRCIMCLTRLLILKFMKKFTPACKINSDFFCPYAVGLNRSLQDFRS